MYQYEFELTMDDYLDFQENYIKNSNVMKKTVVKHRVVVLMVMLIGGYLMTGYTDALSVIIYGILAVLWVVFLPNYYSRSMKRKMKEILLDSEDESFFALRKVVVNGKETSEEIIKYGIVKKWTEIVNISESEKNLFIYISNIEAIIIPKKVIEDKSEYSDFKEYVQKNIKK